MKFKLLFIVPDDNPSVTNQYLQILEITKVLKNKIDFFIIVEKRYPAIIRPFLFLAARLRNYQKAFVYYSYSSLICTKLLGFKTYFWHCHWQTQKEPALDFCLKLTDVLVTGTKTMANQYRKLYTFSNIVILPSWINAKNFSYRPLDFPRTQKIIFYPFRETPSKGSNWLPEIMAAVLKVNPKLVFLRGKGKIPNVDIPSYLKRSKLLILPSPGEGFPRILLEAMAVGVPFVTTLNGGTPDILDEFQKKFTVNYGDTDGFVDKTLLLLANKEIASQMITAGRQQVVKYDIEKIKDKFYTLFTTE